MRPTTFLLPLAALAACSGNAPADTTTPGTATPQPTPTAPSPIARPFVISEVARFNEPWAMAFLPGGQQALITEKSGALKLYDFARKQAISVSGTPKVDYGGQGGLGDIAVAPGFGTADNRRVYLSWTEAGDGDTRGAVVARADLVIDSAGAALHNLQIVWKQTPKVTGRGHFSHRLAFSPDGQSLFISSGDRQKMEPAQDPASALGKIIRLDLASGQTEHWTLGHRNTLGLAFDSAGNLWQNEMGPQGGDEVNLIVKGRNYGWPKVSNGSHYGGADIPDHAPGDGFEAPKLWWNPSISPSSLMIYTGNLFPAWKGDAFIGALSGQALIRVDLDGTTAKKGDQWDMGTRIREVEQGPDGAIWLLEDGENGRLLKLAPTG